MLDRKTKPSSHFFTRERQDGAVVTTLDTEGRKIRVHTPFLTLTSCAQRGKSVKLSKPQSPYLENEDNNAHLSLNCENSIMRQEVRSAWQSV